MKDLQVLNSWHFRRKSRHSLWPRTGHLPEKLPFSPFLPALHCFLIDVMLRATSVSWKLLQRHPHSSCIYLFLPHPKVKESRNAGLFKRDSGTMSSCTGSSFLEVFSLTEKLWGFSFLSARALPSHRHPQTLLQHRVSGLHRPAHLIPCRAATNASPNAKGFKTGSNSHPCTPQPLCLNRA